MKKAGKYSRKRARNGIEHDQTIKHEPDAKSSKFESRNAVLDFLSDDEDISLAELASSIAKTVLQKSTKDNMKNESINMEIKDETQINVIENQEEPEFTNNREDDQVIERENKESMSNMSPQTPKGILKSKKTYKSNASRYSQIMGRDVVQNKCPPMPGEASNDQTLSRRHLFCHQDTVHGDGKEDEMRCFTKTPDLDNSQLMIHKQTFGSAPKRVTFNEKCQVSPLPPLTEEERADRRASLQKVRQMRHAISNKAQSLKRLKLNDFLQPKPVNAEPPTVPSSLFRSKFANSRVNNILQKIGDHCDNYSVKPTVATDKTTTAPANVTLASMVELPAKIAQCDINIPNQLLLAITDGCKIRNLKILLEARKIYTIGELAMINTMDLDNLPLVGQDKRTVLNTAICAWVKEAKWKESDKCDDNSSIKDNQMRFDNEDSVREIPVIEDQPDRVLHKNEDKLPPIDLDFPDDNDDDNNIEMCSDTQSSPNFDQNNQMITSVAVENETQNIQKDSFSTEPVLSVQAERLASTPDAVLSAKKEDIVETARAAVIRNLSNIYEQVPANIALTLFIEIGQILNQYQHDANEIVNARLQAINVNFS